jgi:hypothetical protein
VAKNYVGSLVRRAPRSSQGETFQTVGGPSVSYAPGVPDLPPAEIPFLACGRIGRPRINADANLPAETLANACAQTRYGGVVAACGLAQGADFPATVMPFILRGVSLMGIDSVMAPLARRQQAWDRLARDLDPLKLEAMVTEIALDQAIDYAQALMQGKVRGRIVVKI